MVRHGGRGEPEHGVGATLHETAATKQNDDEELCAECDGRGWVWCENDDCPWPDCEGEIHTCPECEGVTV